MGSDVFHVEQIGMIWLGICSTWNRYTLTSVKNVPRGTLAQKLDHQVLIYVLFVHLHRTCLGSIHGKARTEV